MDPQQNSAPPTRPATPAVDGPQKPLGSRGIVEETVAVTNNAMENVEGAFQELARDPQGKLKSRQSLPNFEEARKSLPPQNRPLGPSVSEARVVPRAAVRFASATAPLETQSEKKMKPEAEKKPKTAAQMWADVKPEVPPRIVVRKTKPESSQVAAANRADRSRLRRSAGSRSRLRGEAESGAGVAKESPAKSRLIPASELSKAKLRVRDAVAPKRPRGRAPEVVPRGRRRFEFRHAAGAEILRIQGRSFIRAGKEPRHARFHCSGAFSAFFWLRDRQGAEFCVARRRTPSFVRSRRSQGCEAPATFGPISHGLGTLSASTAAIPACCRSSGFQASGLGRPFGPEQGTEDPSTGFKVGEPKQFAQTPSFADWSNQDCSSSFEAQIGQIGTRNRKPSSKSWRRQRQINDSRRWTQAGRFRQSDSG
ncbi:hypothetical protein L596_009608 [Steinernema carpocapsae]|uniref:Uncharacterized protein n=1 Tax=Steinernema carpocapsae TaxID=34508 RepID=A0A4U5PFU6_STECR|nr:hypothetical protein L596_009608 [Steinernema carpocapsae]